MVPVPGVSHGPCCLQGDSLSTPPELYRYKRAGRGQTHASLLRARVLVAEPPWGWHRSSRGPSVCQPQ